MRINRIVKRAGMKAKLKQLQKAVTIMDKASAQAFKAGFDEGGKEMQAAYKQAQADAQEKP